MAPRTSYITMHHEFEVYIPTKCRCGEVLPEGARRKVLEDTKRKMSSWFGGATQQIGLAVWIDDDGHEVQECVEIVYSNSQAAAYESFAEDFRTLIFAVGVSLSQSVGAGRIDRKLLLFPTGGGRCIHQGGPIRAAATRPEAAQPGPVDRRRDILVGLSGLKSVDAARSLFVNRLHYEYTNSVLPTRGWPESVRRHLAPGADPVVIAEQNDFKIIYLKLAEDRLLRTPERELVGRILHDMPDMRGLVVVSDANQQQWHLINVKFGAEGGEKSRFVLRRMRVGGDQNMRTAVERLALVDVEALGETVSAAEIQAAHDRAFDVQAVTDAFFARYREIFEDVESHIKCFKKSEGEVRWLFTQQLFNRLMFVAFIERKGWLKLNGRTDYLRALWQDYESSKETDSNFYRDRLRYLFFVGLNNASDIDIVGINRGGILKPLIGEVPFLNGGLFEPDENDQRDDLGVPDRCIRAILIDLFGSFNFTVTESTPLDQEVAVDPEMLGTIFEELVTGRHEQGAYYTPKPIVQFMGREALKFHIQSRLLGETETAISEFVEHHDPSALKTPEQVLDALRKVKVCDPACGSGAYLLGMLHELFDLRACLFAVKELDPISAYDRKLEIIQTNLYGVDIDPFATNIAKLRLWLSLAVEFEGLKPPPLPNLEFKIETGDSLTAPNPQHTDDLFRHQVVKQADTLVELKTRYLKASGPAKRKLAEQIAKGEELLQAVFKDSPAPEGAFDWRVGYADVFKAGGFDMVVSNPPYIRIQVLNQTSPELVEWLKENYESASRGNYDIYVVFVERGLQLLGPKGYLAYIQPHKFFNAQYGRPLRRLIAEGHYLREVVHFGDQQVFAGATNYVCLLFLSKAGTPQCRWVRVRDLPAWLDTGVGDEQALAAACVTESDWNFSVGRDAGLFDKLQRMPVTLQGVTSRIFQGIKTSADKVYIVEEVRRSRGLVWVFSREHDREYPLEPGLLHPLIKGGDSRRFQLTLTERRILFPYQATKGSTSVIPEAQLKRVYPRTWEYLRDHKTTLAAREGGLLAGPSWYAYGRSQALEVMPLPKIFTPDISPIAAFSYDSSGEVFFTGGAAGGYGILVTPPYQPEFLLALLNSRLLDYFHHQVATQMRGGWYSYEARFIRSLPIRPIDFGDPKDRAEHDGLVKLARRILEATNTDPEANTADLEREIDERVYRLYGISDDEIKLVEESATRA